MKLLKMQLFTFIAVLFTNFFSLHTISKAEEPTWVIDKNTGCKVWDTPEPNKSVSWSGECVNGKAHGNGTLIIYKNNIELSKFYFTTKNGLTMVDGHITASVDISSYHFRIREEDINRYKHWTIEGIVNKEINLSYRPVANYIMDKAGHFALNNCSRKNLSPRVTILLYSQGNEGGDDYAVSGSLHLTNYTNDLLWWNEHDNVARNKRISEEEKAYNAKLEEKKRLDQEEKERQQAILAEKKRLEEEKKRQEMEVKERQKEERRRQEMAALKAKEERERAEVIKRRDEFVKKNRVEEWPDISELFANPFIYEGKTVAIQIVFLTMQTATQGLFTGSNAVIVVSDIPKGQFKEAGSIVVLAGKVLGKTEQQLPILGLMQVPHLTFVGVHFCQDNNCKDIIPE